MEAGIGLLMMLGMVVGTSVSAANAPSQVDAINKNLDTLNKAKEDLKSQLTKIQYDVTLIDDTIKNEIQSANDQIIETSRLLKISNEAYAITFKQIQITGVIMISVIFFILLAKNFGLIDALINWIKSLTK